MHWSFIWSTIKLCDWPVVFWRRALRQAPKCKSALEKANEWKWVIKKSILDAILQYSESLTVTVRSIFWVTGRSIDCCQIFSYRCCQPWLKLLPLGHLISIFSLKQMPHFFSFGSLISYLYFFHYRLLYMHSVAHWMGLYKKCVYICCDVWLIIRKSAKAWSLGIPNHASPLSLVARF